MCNHSYCHRSVPLPHSTCVCVLLSDTVQGPKAGVVQSSFSSQNCCKQMMLFKFSGTPAIIPMDAFFPLASSTIIHHGRSMGLKESQCFSKWLHKFVIIQSLSLSIALQLHGLQHARLPCPSLTPGVCSNSCPSS